MTPETALSLVIRPTTEFMGEKYGTRDAHRMLLAIGLQESQFEYREQVSGPAHGYWQFERDGGVAAVLSHKASKQLASGLCLELDYPPTITAVYQALPDNAILACIFARLLLYTDPKPLPTTQTDGWSYYLRNWRPGIPHPSKWRVNWKRAEEALA